MMKKIYGWKSGARFSVDAQLIGEALARLNEPTAEDIVKEAKSENSPLHELFNWDLKSAAYEHWLATAQMIGRSITITVTMEDKEHTEIEVRAFETVDKKEENTKCYVPVEKVLSKDEYRNQVMARIRGTLESAEKELDVYSYMSSRIVKAAKKVHEAVKVLVTDRA